MTEAEKMVLKTVHDLGTAGVSDVYNYTGLSADDAPAAFASLRKKRYIRIVEHDFDIEEDGHGGYAIVRFDCLWEFTPKGKEAAKGLPDIDEPMCIPITRVTF
nr:MAG TPA: Rio2, N-terminal [Bacteriophage sp.]